MSKLIVFNKDAKEGLRNGVMKLCNAVAVTMGPSGRNVIIERDGGLPTSTKDGVTVSESISSSEPIENIGIEIVKQAARKTADKAGDGTTTATVLAANLVDKGLNLANQSTNLVELKRGMEIGSHFVIESLKNLKVEVSQDKLKEVATISANNDSEIGNLIAEAMIEVGKEGVVTIEESKDGETSLEAVEGIQFDRGYKSPYFVTDNDRMNVVLDKPLILIYNGKISSIKDMLPILEEASRGTNSLLIIAEDVEGEALATLIVNKTRGILKVCAVKAPEFGDRRTAALEDIAIVTGGTVCSIDKGISLKNIKLEHLGKCRSVTVDKDNTTIIDGFGTQEAIEKRVTELKTQFDNAKSNFDKQNIQERLAKLVGGVVIINVGGVTEVEIKEKKDRVDDALHATKAALEEGIVPGGGIALLRMSTLLNEKKNDLTSNTDQLLGIDLLIEVLETPFNEILKNAGVDNRYKIQNSLGKDFWDGYNVKTQTFVNLLDNGVIDPFKVTRLALENAVSVAGTILTTECVVYNEKKEETDEPQF